MGPLHLFFQEHSWICGIRAGLRSWILQRGKTLPEFVLKAFQGNLEDCRNVVQLALLQNDDLEEMITEAF